MVQQNAHKTCTDWSSTRLYDPLPTLLLKSYPTLSPSRSTTPSSMASSTTLTPTPSTTPPQPKSFLTDLAAISASPPALPSPSPSPPSSYNPPRGGSSGIGGGSLHPPSSSSSFDPPPPPRQPTTATTTTTLHTITSLEALHAAASPSSPSSGSSPAAPPPFFTHLPCPHPHPRCPDPTCRDPTCAPPTPPTTTSPPPPPPLHTDAILVSIHGAYSHHHAHHRPFAAAAVFFAPASPLNRVVRLDEEYPGVGVGGAGEVGGEYAGGKGGGGGGGREEGMEPAGHVDGGSSFGEVTRQRVELLAGIRALERVADVVRALEEGARARRGERRARKKEGGVATSMGAPGSRDWYVAGVEKKTGWSGGGGVVGLGLGDDEGDEGEDEEDEEDEDEDGALSQVVIKTHSKYLVRAGVEGLDKWKANGWMNSKGRVVANVDLLWYLDRRITWLEWVGVEVMFLLVGKEDNEGAIKLVGKTLD
ncbi:ribonuclease h [Diplodia corticola]|uniref:Ribonuclease h n=1 Tax=Diplodia corticola TaxID=236234 RepID=A0A1J9RZ33_9PEZI|nr:ribonuclease h [Diplodia corticola]OJD33060.1 ribonuclease h [Diplodia corticola]